MIISHSGSSAMLRPSAKCHSPIELNRSALGKNEFSLDLYAQPAFLLVPFLQAREAAVTVPSSA